MTMETLQLVLTISALAVALLTTIITAVAKNCKNTKLARAATNLLKVMGAVEGFVVEAEKLTQFTGPFKKEWVLTKVNEFCLKNNIAFEQEKVDKLLEDAIKFSKNVNAKKIEEEEAL